MLVKQEETGEVVGGYRLLTGKKALRIGGFYADEEFDFSPAKLKKISSIRDRQSMRTSQLQNRRNPRYALEGKSLNMLSHSSVDILWVLPAYLLKITEQLPELL